MPEGTDDKKQLTASEAQDAAYDAAFDAIAGKDEADVDAGEDDAKAQKGKADDAQDEDESGDDDAQDDAESGDDAEETEGDDEETDDAQDDAGEDDEAGDDEDDDGAQDEDEDELLDDSRTPAVYRGKTMRERITAARVALAKSGLFTRAEIDSMDKTALLKRGAQLLKADAAFAKLRDRLAKAPKTASPKTDDGDFSDETEDSLEDDDDERSARRGRSEPDDDDDAPPSGPSPKRLDKAVRSVVDELNLTDDEASVVKKALKRAVTLELQARETVLQKQRSAMQVVEKQMHQLASSLVTTRLQAGIAQLSSKFPQLKDPASQKSFIQHVARYDSRAEHALGDAKEYVNFLNDMAWSVFGREAKKAAKQELLSSATKAQKSQALVDGVRKPPGGPLTQSQAEDRILDVMMSDSLSKSEKDRRIAQIKTRIVNTPPKAPKKPKQ